MKTVDYVVDGIEEYTALNIISSQSEEIKTMIVNELRKGISVYKGERGIYLEPLISKMIVTSF
jgi:uncharacterized membrane-anchored protein YitT (DUF2179 family)